MTPAGLIAEIARLRQIVRDMPINQLALASKENQQLRAENERLTEEIEELKAKLRELGWSAWADAAAPSREQE